MFGVDVANDAVISSVLVVIYPGWSIILPLAAILTRLGSVFCGR